MSRLLLACLTALCSIAATASAPPDASSRRGLRTSFGHVLVDPVDLRRATEEGEAARTAARDVLGLPDVRFSIVEAGSGETRWGDVGPDGETVYPWTFNVAPGGGSPPPSHLLRHEIGHDLFVRHLVPSTRAGQYGGDAPDWLDEMAAVAFEGAGLRDVRRRQSALLAREGALIPLRRFLRMDHPELSNSAMWDPAPSAPGGPVPFREAVSGDTAAFYAMACAFHEYLVARTGDAAIVAAMGKAFRRGSELEAWLLARTKTSDLVELDRAFRDWITADPRYAPADRR